MKFSWWKTAAPGPSVVPPANETPIDGLHPYKLFQFSFLIINVYFRTLISKNLIIWKPDFDIFVIFSPPRRYMQKFMSKVNNCFIRKSFNILRVINFFCHICLSFSNNISRIDHVEFMLINLFSIQKGLVRFRKIPLNVFDNFEIYSHSVPGPTPCPCPMQFSGESWSLLFGQVENK